MPMLSRKGPSIKDVSPKGEGGGYKKCPKRRRSLSSRFEETRGGRVPQKSKIWGDVVYGWSLIQLATLIFAKELES